MKKKKPNPQDATRRNVRAANKKLAELFERVSKLENQAHDAWSSGAKITNLELRLLKLEERDTPREDSKI